jgi:hypothetical protein
MYVECSVAAKKNNVKAFNIASRSVAATFATSLL